MNGVMAGTGVTGPARRWRLLQWLRRRLWRLTAGIAGAALVAAAAGCSTTTGSRPAPPVDDGAMPGRTDLLGTGCAAAPSGSSPQRPPSPAASPTPVPEHFAAARAQRCVVTTVVEPGDGEWQVRVDQEATTGLAALVTALQRPPSPAAAPQRPSPSAGARCPAIAYAPIDLTLTDVHGVTITPAIPRDACGQPAADVRRAVEALPWTTTAQTKIRQVRGQLEVASGCPGRFKPVVAFNGASTDHAGRASGPWLTGASSSLRVCRYVLDPASTVSIGGPTPSYGGRLDTVGTLTGEPLTRLLTMFDAAPDAAPGACTAPQAPFAVVMPAEGSGAWLAVELGGCYRATDDRGRLRQLDADAAGLLAG